MRRPLGLLISGNPGIGKSHLSVSIGKYINNYGKKLLFVDESYVAKQYNLTNGRETNYTEIFNESQIDLIIIDDTNIQAIGRMIIKSALKYVFEQNKAIVITSNNDINSFVVYLPQFFNYNDPIGNNFKYIRNLQLQSKRTPWTDTIRNKTLIDLFGYNDSKASGIIIEASIKDINNLTRYKTELENLYDPRMLSTSSMLLIPSMLPIPSTLPIPIMLPKIRIADTPYDAITHRVKDMYVYDACTYDYIIINVYDNSETEQLINLVDLVHNCGKKIVIICSTIDKLVSMINDRFRTWLSIGSGKTNPRLISRIKSILPGLEILS